MVDERQYISRVESADADELAQLLERPSRDEEKALRAYLGDARYRRLHQLALKRRTRAAVRPRGNVVVIHGIMGGELSAFNREGRGDRIWLVALRLIDGGLERLRLDSDGRAEADNAYEVRATGILKRHYGELLLALSQRWNVRAFWFDWRKDLKHAAAELDAQISGWFGDDAPVHIVAHSMGGLVARAFAKRQAERWAAMWDGVHDGERGGRLIMLGTPNHGSFAIPQAIAGLEGVVRKLALLDVRHDDVELLRILNSFVGTYQMLPSPLAVPAMEPLYESATYGALEVPQAHLDNAREHHAWLSDLVDPSRMVYVAGSNRPTLSGTGASRTRSGSWSATASPCRPTTSTTSTAISRRMPRCWRRSTTCSHGVRRPCSHARRPPRPARRRMPAVTCSRSNGARKRKT
jgi:pimeloyl-ACP methyl ester carboxylesterase